MSRTYSPRQIVFGVVALAVLVYANTLLNGFAYDDIGIVQTNPYITDWRQIPELFTKGYWSHRTGGVGNYRPLALSTFALEYTIWGLSPLGYHLTNLILHAANTALCFHLLRSYRVAPGMSGLAALVFAVHPVHTEAVANVVGRSELLGASFGGLMWWAWIRARQATRPGASSHAWSWAVWRWRGLAVGAYFAALLSKENMLTLPAALWLGELLYARRACLIRGTWSVRLGRVWRLTSEFWVFAVVLVPYFGLRTLAGEAAAQTLGVGIIPLASYTLWQRAIVMLDVSLIWYRLLVVGYPLRPWYDGTNVALSLDWSWLKGLGLCLNAGLVMIMGWAWRRAPLVTFAVGFWFITMAIVSNVLFPLGALLGERWLYVPSAGYAIALGYGGWIAWQKTVHWALRYQASQSILVSVLQVVLVLAFGSLLGGYVYRAAQRNLDWRDNYTLFSRFMETDPGHPLGYVNVGDAIANVEPERARALYEKAIELEPRSFAANIRLTTLDVDAGAFEAARARAERMLALEPPGLPLPSNEWGLVYGLYAQALAALGERELALSAAQTALRYGPESPQPLLAAGEAFALAGERATAISVYRRLTTLLPKTGGPRARLGVLLLEAGDAAAAERELTIAAQQLPDSPLVKDWLEQARRQAAVQP